MNDGPITNPTDPPADQPPVDERWNQLQSMIPDPIKPLVESDLKTWYDQVSESLNVDPKLEAFKQFAEQYDPNSVETALRYAEQLNKDPVAVFKMLQEELPKRGFELPGSSVSPPPIDEPPVDSFEAFLEEIGEEDISPALKKALKMQYDLIQSQGQVLETLGGVVTQREELTLQERQEAALEAVLKPLQEANPETFDREYIVAKIANGKTAEQAMEELNAFAAKFKPTEPAPVVIGAGALPSNQRPVTELTTDETNKLVAEIAKAAAAANQ